MPDLDDYLREMRSEGQADSSGHFALDIRKAIEKLAHFFPPEGRDFLHYWIRFAVFFAAPEISLDDSDSHLSMEFSGPGPEAEQVRTLFTQSEMGLRYLQLGVIGALHQGYGRVELETPGFVAVFGPNEQSLDPSTRHRRCCLRASKAAAPQSRWSALTRWLPREVGFPHRDFRFLETPLKGVRHQPLLKPGVDEIKAVDGSPGPWRVLRSPLAGPRLWLLARRQTEDFSAPAPARLILVVHGAQFEVNGRLGQFPPASRVILEAPEARMDLSLRQLADPALPPDSLREAEERVAQLLLQDEEPLAPELGGWLVDYLIHHGRKEEALQVAQTLVARLASVDTAFVPFHAALPERAALLLRAAGQPPDEKLEQRAEEAWAILDRAARAEEGGGLLDNQETRSRPGRDRLLGQAWANFLKSGGVETPDHPWQGRCLPFFPLPVALSFYRHLIRRSILPGEIQPRFAEMLVKYRSDSLMRNYFLAQHFLTQDPSRIPWDEAVYCGELLLAAQSGQESVPDLPDLRQSLNALERLELCLLVKRLCQHLLAALPVASRRFDVRLLRASARRQAHREDEAISDLRSLLGELQSQRGRKGPIGEAQRERLRYELHQAGLHEEAHQVPR